jgi:hypothetical protein
MNLETMLRVLKPAEEVQLADIAQKLDISRDQAEQEIIALLTTKHSLGAFNVFTGTFTRGKFYGRIARWVLIPIIVTALMIFTFLVLPMLIG